LLLWASWARPVKQETPPFGFLEFVIIYVLFVAIVLLALPRRISNPILETLFPILRRML